MNKQMANEHLVMPKDHMDEVYTSSNHAVRFVHQQRLEAIISLIPKGKSLKILDAGCGEGHLILKMHQKYGHNSYYGVDVTEVALKSAVERCKFAEFKLIDLAKLDFEDGLFDVVIITEVIEHIIDYKKVVSELKRVMKKGGVLIITFPNEPLWTAARFLLGRRPIKISDHVNSFTPGAIKDVVGLETISQKGLPFSLPFFISLGYIMEFRK